jgi:hypothetical protein
LPLRPPAYLLCLIEEVTGRVKDYRDDHVAHERFPESKPGLALNQVSHEVIRPGERRSPAQAEPIEYLLDRYVNAWLDYLDTIPWPFNWPEGA